MASKAVQKLAIRLAASYLAEYNRYVEECESYRRDGFRPHYCEHGTNCWTDYDNICGPCEDGLSMSDGVFRRQHALDVAKARDEECKRIVKAAQVLTDARIPVDMAPIWKRVTELLTV